MILVVVTADGAAMLAGHFNDVDFIHTLKQWLFCFI